jgi:hypothetical protein
MTFVHTHYPRLSRVSGLATWTFLLVLGIISLASWFGALGPMRQFSLAIQAVLGLTASVGAIVVCAACWVLNRIAHRAGSTAFMPDPTLGRATAIASTAALAALGLLTSGGALPTTSSTADVWAWMIVGATLWLLLISVVTATILSAKFWKATVATIAFSVIGAVVAVMAVLSVSLL